MPALSATFAKLLAMEPKSATGPYQAGERDWLWIKFKREYQKQLADTFDLVVVGAIRGKGHGREAMDRCFLLPSILLRADITPRIFR